MKTYSPPTITVHMQPEEKTLELARPKTVLQLLTTLGLGLTAALVIRDGELLTHDRHIAPNDTIIVRLVASSG